MSEIAATLEGLRRDGLFRALREVQSAPGAHVEIDGRRVLLACSNDYLGLAGDARVRDAAAEAAQLWGAGAGSSRLVAGNSSLHSRLEQQLADFKGAAACVLFGSGYLANVGIVSALGGAGSTIFSDALNHASLVDGCRLARAQTIVYPHRDLDALKAGLLRTRPERGSALIVTDAVFSMDGDLAPLVELVELARQFGARLIVDEAHATGVIGASGRGLVAELGLEREVNVVIGTLGKALGSYGAFACCSDPEIASYLVNRARTLIFSTALPPPAVGAALAALAALRCEPGLLMGRLHDNASLMRSALAGEGFDVSPGTMPIIPLVVGDAAAAMGLCELALARGVFAQAIRPPTVPPGTSRLRVVVMAVHAPQDLLAAARVIGDCARELGLLAAAVDQAMAP